MSISRYAIVGAAATAVHYGVLTLLVEVAGLAASASAALGAVVGATFAYSGNWRFTFGADTKLGKALPSFLAVAALSASISAGLVVLLSPYLHYIACQLAATGVILLTGYWLNRRWTFAP